jgi:endonuclease III
MMADAIMEEALQKLINTYKSRKYPLEYRSRYELVVMVILAAQDSNRNINNIAPALLNAFPDMQALEKATADDLYKYVSKARNFGNKINWLVNLAQKLKEEKNIPHTLYELTKLPGIGKKSANIILRESGEKPEGIMVDLHGARVAARLGFIKENENNSKKMEQDIMKNIPEKYWSEIGFSMSFLGMDICRPTNPKHEECTMKTVCPFYAEVKKKN